MQRPRTPAEAIARRPHLPVWGLLPLALVLALLVTLLPRWAGTAGAVEVKWARTFTGGIDTVDKGLAVAMAPDGNVVAAGTLGLDDGGRLGWLRKYTPSGSLLWGRRIKVGRQKIYNSASGVAVTSDGSIYVCGTYHEKASGYNDTWLARYTSGGDLVWRRTWGAKAGLNDGASGVATGPGGEIYVTGKSEATADNDDLFVLRYDSAGNRLWVRRFDGAAGYDDGGAGVAVAPDGSIYVSGTTQYDSTNYHTDIWLLKLLPPKGKLEWVRQVHGDGCPSTGSGVAVTSRGQAYVSGTLCTATEGLNGWLGKFKPGGGLAWDVEFHASPANGDGFVGVSVTPRNAPVVTGRGGSSLQDPYLVTTKYTRKGEFAWSARYQDDDQEQSYGLGVAAAIGGATYVVGGMEPVNGNDDVVVLKIK